MKNSTKWAGIVIIIVSAFLLTSIDPVKGQTIPRKVCLEHFTASTCPPCASFGPVFRQTLSGFQDQYTIIRYQMYWPGTGDPYYFPESKKRRDYYTITGVPGLACNGVKQLPYAQSFSVQQMDSLVQLFTGCEIGITSSVNTDKIVTATITITPEIAYPAGLVAQIVVMEGVTTQNVGTNGEKSFDHVTMGFMPNADGTVLPALVPGTPVVLTYTMDMKTTHSETANDLIVAAFIQDNATKNVIQSNNAPVSHPFTDYTAVLNIIDNDYNTVPGGKAFIPYYGEKIFGEDGQATFNGVFPGTLTYEVSAPGYDGTSGEVDLVNADIKADVMIDKPDLFFFEDFGWNNIPEGWISETTNGFNMYGSGSADGTIVFYKPNEGNDDSYLILPAINLNQTGIFSFKAGLQSGTPDLRIGIATLATTPGTEGTSGISVTGFAELYAGTISNATGYSLYGFQLPETIGNQRLAIRFVGAAGSYCYLDQVAVLEDNPGVKVQFLVTDQNDAPLANTTVTLADKTVANNAYGYATFRDTDLGNYTYSVKYKDQEIATGVLTVDDALLKEIKHNTSGIDVVPAETVVSIYPNPVKDQFTVKGVQTGTITILTANGQELIRRQILNGDPISTEGLAKGLYLIKIESEKKSTYHKILISK
jgi:hypothetical protein